MTSIERTRWRIYNVVRMVRARRNSGTIRAWLLAIVAMLIYAIAAGSVK